MLELNNKNVEDTEMEDIQEDKVIKKKKIKDIHLCTSRFQEDSNDNQLSSDKR